MGSLRIAITRPRERLQETEERVREHGFEPFVVSPIEIVPLPVDASIRLDDFDWLVVTSASGADALWAHFKEGLRDIDIAVVGPKTEAAFLKRGVRPSLVAGEHVGEALAAELKDVAAGKKVLVARAAIARKGLVEMLREVADVTEIAVYDTRFPEDTSRLRELKKMLEEGDVDAIIFTSSRSAKNLIRFFGEDATSLLADVIVCAIGPITAGSLEKMGIEVDCMPAEYTIDAALEEIRRFSSSEPLS
ncbi:MAG: uroporphyrinogen-III synthase [Methanobacteriota archaeon]|nr:MAG: uroporphyrinogen-III synthase [Euryarchaeota archaeon]